MNSFSDTRPSSAGAPDSPESAPGASSALAVFCADGEAPAVARDTFPSGFDGRLSLKNPGSLTDVEAGTTLARLGALVSWAQAQQALVVARIEELFARDIAQSTGREDPAWAQSLAAAEVGAILNLPHMSALRLANESDTLCTGHTQTLRRLSEGRISYQHARVVLDEAQFVPDGISEDPACNPGCEGLDDLPDGGPACSARARFERDLLAHAEGITAARFTAKARRLRESLFPDTIPVRHKDALAKRRVCFEARPDGMSCISAFLAAEKGLAIHSALTAAARGEKSAGDERSMDQLRADILQSLLLDGGLPISWPDEKAPSVRGAGVAGDPAPIGRPFDVADSSRKARAPRNPKARKARRNGLRTEVMVLINADTLAGLDESPVELNGYGPLSPEAGRRMISQALSWTPLVQDPASGEILGVGRRRRIPAGLKRWLQARDGTCRFPGCGVSVQSSQIDHTRPWAHGGNTVHSNLEHLCPKHHRFKTLGHWKARQPEPGTIEWTSPMGRSYRTTPMFGYGARVTPGGHWTPPDSGARQGSGGGATGMGGPNGMAGATGVGGPNGVGGLQGTVGATGMGGPNGMAGSPGMPGESANVETAHDLDPPPF
ncbi:DUF222 domain-containing protein [Arthrobacter sp. Sa2BUA2]|uniref:DUF222 domain-containing protein n=1 Tax=Arthrobacter pullicola TaxID=2762224 RepID=A0ABR8YH04_9MICC|nr:HNH endonuclease signature motif containing protein [Arthrobacter pullicola]MBD8043488.1 DUF222 domain-containing protein [Arthrobacter pullicola]